MEVTMVTKLKLVRISKDKKQWEVASETDIHPTTLSHYESGRKRAPFEHRYRLARYFGIDVDELFPEEGIA